MTAILHRILPIALSLLVVLTGQGLAVSRGVDRAVDQMVLCTGSGPVVVYMDEDGQPTKAPHFCPDYGLSLLGAVDADPLDLPLAPRQIRAELPAFAGNLIAAPLPRKPARAPPLFV